MSLADLALEKEPVRLEVMLVAKAFDRKVISFTRQVACHLIDSSALDRVDMHVLVDYALQKHPCFQLEQLMQHYPHYRSHMHFYYYDEERQKCWLQQNSQGRKECLACDVDLVISLGGDGTVLYTSWLFQVGPVPPILPFHLGSLGFLTNFDVEDINEILQKVVHQDWVRLKQGRITIEQLTQLDKRNTDYFKLNVRMRFHCVVWRKNADRADRVSENVVEFPSSLDRSPSFISCRSLRNDDCMSSSPVLGINISQMNEKLDHAISSLQPCMLNPESPLMSTDDATNTLKYSPIKHALPTKQMACTESFEILNDLVDRGPSPYMSQLELYVDDVHLTTVQADGLVIATPTGSTAYSLSAGGSLTHPAVPAILVSPICPHTLSFRPMLLPETIELKIQVPTDSRATCWASFDGRHRIELKQGDCITITRSRWPIPTICKANQSEDWFHSLRRCLYWNERSARQKGLQYLIPENDRENDTDHVADIDS